MKESLQNKFKAEYEKRTETPSPNLWDRIEAELDFPEKTQLPRESRKINRSWNVAAVILLLVSVGLFTKMMWENDSAVSESVPQTYTSKEVPVKSESEEDGSAREIISEKQDLQPRQKIYTEILAADENPAPHTPDAKVVTQIPAESIVLLPTPGQLEEVRQPEETIVRSNSKYITADELLFVREVHQRNANRNHEGRLVEIDLDKLQHRQNPATIKIFGFTVYERESPE